MADKELEQAISEFVGAFEIVFRYDWEYSSTCMGFHADGANFVEPGLEDETEDWGSRGALLEKYRNLVSVMKARNMAPQFPFPLERVAPDVKRVW